MAHVCRIAFFFVVLAMVILSAAAQDSEPAPAPAPGIQSGAGLPATLSGLFLSSSLLFSLAAFLMH
ncbi:hypothetical protein PanWU01x14_367770 [Parasponia andersonii]|uniref:Arabinogalactan peptide n=1 Tax=Parasponia andersonii TaxID=3476 RepID=A0A2P5A578_PARAD|nr:hypothetical protein PanWU01x14_367770 [Parasponia andersonii]